MKVWKWKSPHKVRFFLWLAIQGKLLTKCSRVRRQMTADASCDWCGHLEESVAHVLRDCVFAAESWSKLEGFDLTSNYWQEEAEAWIKRGLSMANGLLFGIHCWMLWKVRNERIFIRSNLNPLGVAIRSIHWVRQVSTAMELNRNTLDVGLSRRVEDIQRDPGPSGWVTLNTDGSVDRRGSKATAGGLKREWEVRIEHTYRERNQAADFLASIGHVYPVGSHTFDISDCRLVYFLRLDCYGVGFPRSYLIND
ncbi:Putative ribonuclease H protein At1g65750 [Linum perenne]